MDAQDAALNNVPGVDDSAQRDYDASTADEGFEKEVEDEVRIEKYSITSYGADIDVAGLVRRLDNHDIEIPHFQRNYVWSEKDASRFIESLLLGLPVPSIFLCKDESSKLLVIDGQQRLRSLQYFYNGVFEPRERKFTLKDVQSEFIGLEYKTLSEEDRRTLDDSLMHSIIIRQEEPSDDDRTRSRHF